MTAAPDDPIDWIESEFYIPERGGAIQLADYHKQALREAYRVDANGQYVYSTVVWSDIKKSAKSSIAAAVVLERARRTPYGSFKIVANDLKQADSRVAFYARRAIELNERLRDVVRVKPSGYKIEFPNSAVIEAIPVDPTGEAGGNDDLIVFSELWGASGKAAARMWTEMTLSPTKYGYSQRWVETYAGFSGESELLEQLYQAGVKDGTRLDNDLELYANEAARLLVMWNTQPRCSWQTPAYYAQEAGVLTPSEFQRVHRNQWATSESVFVPGQWWDACRADVPPLEKGTPLVLAMDAGVTSDCFALVGVSRVGDTVAVRYTHAWIPPKHGALDFALPEREVRRLSAQYNVVCVAYDPYQLHDMATRLGNEGVAWMYEFKQGEQRLKADKLLYDMIRDRRMMHDGDGSLREHVTNANAKTEGEKLRIIKRAEHLKIDLAVALSMATERATALNLD